ANQKTKPAEKIDGFVSGLRAAAATLRPFLFGTVKDVFFDRPAPSTVILGPDPRIHFQGKPMPRLEHGCSGQARA
ncbi:hypothetical protein ACQKGL_21675, partial [Ensifer adhaerens]|uniref:hypothetical protein n=1 Tax=Ensifer adhaerens TaxID=106592 RepID=UPI003D03915A